MNNADIAKKLKLIGLVPVIKLDDVEKAVPLARALADGGIPCAEITFRTAQAEESIKRITAELPGMLVGAGTVLTVDQADRALAAGAKFAVAPGLNPKIAQHCIEIGLPFFPGCSGPSDIEAALEMGFKTVKFFPAEQLGGVKTLKALAAPYTEVSFMPTGGVNEANIADYLAFDKVVACGGSWMAEASLVASGNFAEITRLAAKAVKTVLGFKLESAGDGPLGAMFGAGETVVSTPNMDRAVAYLKSKGFEADGGVMEYNGAKIRMIKK